MEKIKFKKAEIIYWLAILVIYSLPIVILSLIIGLLPGRWFKILSANLARIGIYPSFRWISNDLRDFIWKSEAQYQINELLEGNF